MIFIGALISCNIQKEPLVLIESDSSYSDYTVEEDTVFIKCTVAVKNRSDKDIRFKIIGSFPYDEGTLLKEKNITAKDRFSENAVFSIGANEQRTYDVVFVGNYAGTDQKYDRTLPEISFEIVE